MSACEQCRLQWEAMLSEAELESTELKAQLQAEQWTKVEDGLPERRKKYPEWFSIEVLVNVGSEYSVGTYDHDGHLWRSGRGFASESITLWKPITPPKEEKKGQ